MFSGGRSRVVAGLAGLALVALALAGCGGGGSKPVSLPSLSPTVTTSASPAPSASVAAAVTQVVRRYYALLNAPTTVANGEALATLMAEHCSCRRVATSTIDAAHKRETYFGVTKVVSITPVVDSAGTADALVEYDYTVSGLKDANGRVISRSAARRGSRLMFYFALVSGGWVISEVRSISSGHPA